MKSIINILQRKFRLTLYDLFLFFLKEKTEISDIQIDVIIPAIKKNLDTLPLCIQGIRTCVTQPVKNIYIVAPKTDDFLQVCKKENVTFVDENSVLGYSPKDIHIISGGYDRSGWMFQQFLKLSGNVGTERYFLVCDADHILIKPHCFITQSGKFIFYQSAEYNRPYYDNMRKIVRIKYVDCLSYVSHKMIFDKHLLSDLRNKIEKRHHQKWDKAILHSLDTKFGSPFSEFEVYGHFVPNKNKIKKLWRNKNLHNREITDYIHLQKEYSEKYNAVTFPNHSIYI